MAGKHQGHVRALVGKFVDQCLDLTLGVRVQAGGGLVQQQHLRRKRPGPRQGHALLLPARQRAGVAQRQVGQPHALQRGAGARHGIKPGHTAQPQAQHDVAQHRHAHQVRALEQHGLAHLRVAQHLPACGRGQAMQHAQQRALAAAVGPHQCNTLASTHGHIHIHQRTHTAGGTTKMHAGLRQAKDLGHGAACAVTARNRPPSACSRQ